MNIFEKYKLYRSVMKQKPLSVIVYAGKYMIYDTDSYKVDIYSIKKSDFLYVKPRFFRPIYFANVSKKNENGVISFDGFMAKKLFQYGKQYQK